MENKDSGGDGHARIAALMTSVMQLEAEAQEAKYEADAAEDRMVRINGVIAAAVAAASLSSRPGRRFGAHPRNEGWFERTLP